MYFRTVEQANATLNLQGDAILAVLGMIRGYPPDEVDVVFRDSRSSWHGFRQFSTHLLDTKPERMCFF